MKKCPNCIKHFDDDAAIFCPYCDSPLLDTLASPAAFAETVKASMNVNEQDTASANSQVSQVPTSSPEYESEKVEYFKHLSLREKGILGFYINRKTKSLRLRYDEGTVVGLIKAGVLYYASNRASNDGWTLGEYLTDINMKLWAWKYLNEHAELIRTEDSTNNESLEPT